MKLLLKYIPLTCAFLILSCLPLYAYNNKALLIGISQYSELNCLAYADEDVKAFADILTNFSGYKSSDIVKLVNLKATKANIEKELYRAIELSEKKPIDHFIIMFAGHGAPGKIQQKQTSIFLAPSDASTSQNKFFYTGREVLNETFINKAWLAKQLASINAKSTVLIIDSCYSGIKDFGRLFTENLGYKINYSESDKSLRGVVVVQKKGLNESFKRKIAFLASSREDQPATEYPELRHGALSYCIFEHLKEIRVETDYNESKDISVGSLFSNVSRLFDTVKVQGGRLGKIHQPILFPIPDYDNVEKMRFVSVQGIKKKVIRKGMIYIITDPEGAEVYIDGDNTGKRSNCTLELSEGKHHIDLFLPETNYRHSFTADIRYGYPERKQISLLGNLKVESFWEKKGRRTVGPRLNVYLDGKYKGKTKLTLENLVAGTHVLKVKYANVTKKRRIEIRPLSPLLVKYTVIRKPASRDEVKDSVDSVLF